MAHNKNNHKNGGKKIKNFIWPGNAKAAVTLTYDDGLDSQVENGLPCLDRLGIKGTFFPSGAALLDADRHPRWTAVAAGRHEIGCHTLHHACDMKWEFARKGYALQDYSLQRMKEELEENIKIINSLGYRPQKYVFAYPCGESSLGQGMGQSYKPLVSEMFFAARGAKQEYAVPGQIDIMETPCLEANTGAEGLIKIVEEAKKTGSWAIILFHGIGADYISVTKEAHEVFIKYLAENRAGLHIDTFGAVAGLLAK